MDDTIVEVIDECNDRFYRYVTLESLDIRCIVAHLASLDSDKLTDLFRNDDAVFFRYDCCTGLLQKSVLFYPWEAL